MKWNEHEIIECLGVLPEADEFFESQDFKLSKDGITLNLLIYQYESLCSITLSKENDPSPLLELSFIVRSEIGFTNEANLSRLKFNDCIFVDDRFWQSEKFERKKYFDRSLFPTQTRIELTVLPQLSIRVLELTNG